jgi:hypothetical protein
MVVTRTVSVLRAERIQPPQVWKAAEVLVRRCQRGPVLNRQRGQDGIRYQRTDGVVNQCVARPVAERKILTDGFGPAKRSRIADWASELYA